MKKQQYNDTIFADYCRFFDNGSILWRKNDCYTIILEKALQNIGLDEFFVVPTFSYFQKH